MLKIGVDGGGTTTRAVVIELSTELSGELSAANVRVLARGKAPSSNHYAVGLDGAAHNIEQAVEGALYDAKITREQIGAWGFGLAGACSDFEKTQLRAALAPLCGSTPCVVDEDAAAAQRGAFAGGPGAICIAGTGANCFGVNARGTRARADGWGPLLGDRGGGYRIGEAALRGVCAALDGSGQSTSLLQPCLAQLGAANADELVQIVYSADFTRDRIAALFPLVLAAAEKGDGLATAILADAAQALAHTARAVLQKLNLNRIALLGGVLENAPLVREQFTQVLQAEIAHLEIVSPRYDAAIGAALFVQ